MSTKNNVSTILDISTQTICRQECHVDNIRYVHRNDMSPILDMSIAENHMSKNIGHVDRKMIGRQKNNVSTEM